MADPVRIIDTSSIIRIKRSIASNKQPEVFNRLGELVRNGTLAFPKQVVEELERYAEKDLPFYWANENHGNQRYTSFPYEYVRRVMSVAGDVVDSSKDREDADPYVLAMALYIQESGQKVEVVTQEKRDKLGRISMATACARLGLKCIRIEDLLAEQGM